MCKLVKQSSEGVELEERFDAELANSDYEPSGDIDAYQHSAMPVITSENKSLIQLCHWGLLPAWASDTDLANNTINARIETLHEKPSFKDIVHQRCLVPANGFYEWQWLSKTGAKKQKYLIEKPGKELFAFAGLWSRWHPRNGGESLNTFTIVTVEAEGIMREIHNSKLRMPLVLTPENERNWLNGDDYKKFDPYTAFAATKITNGELSLFD